MRVFPRLNHGYNRRVTHGTSVLTSREVPPASRESCAPGARWHRAAAFWLALGALLRLVCAIFPRDRDDDTDVYLELGRNLLHRGTYGFLDEGTVSPALFRLPGYPIFLGALGGHTGLIFLVQSLVDLAGCYLLGRFLRRYVSPRAGLAAVAISSTCLFTAIYAACALTESLSAFAVAAAIFCLGELLLKPDAFAFAGWRKRLLPLAATAMLAMLLRPDGALLTLATAAALLVYGTRRAGMHNAVRTAGLYVLLAIVPLVPWAIRNAVTFHVFQPLAPRHVNDPGERVNLGFYRWLRTWAVDFETTSRVFWKVGTETIDPAALSSRAFDSRAQQAATYALLAEYNQRKDLTVELDNRFNALADERIHAHPIDYFVKMPVLRVLDMWLRPRTEGMEIHVSWWRWREHRGQSAVALALGLLNLAYVLAAVAGACRRPPLAVLLATYLALRCLLLATLENPEPRYTLEAFPILFVLAALLFRRRTPAPDELHPAT